MSLIWLHESFLLHEELESSILIILISHFDSDLDAIKDHHILLLSKFASRNILIPVLPLVHIKLLGVHQDATSHHAHHMGLELGTLVDSNVHTPRFEHEDHHSCNVRHENGYFYDEPLEGSSSHLVV